MTWSSLALAVRMRRRTPGLSVATVIRRGSPLMSSLDAIAYQYTRTTHLHNPLPEKDDPIMKSRLIAAVGAMLLLPTVGAAGATAAPTTTTAVTPQQAAVVVPAGLFKTLGYNSPLSNRSLTFATGKNGAGSWRTVHPGKATTNIQSVYAPSGCITVVNAVPRKAGTWVNKGWHTHTLSAFTLC